jgi:hypothetical protein
MSGGEQRIEGRKITTERWVVAGDESARQSKIGSSGGDAGDGDRLEDNGDDDERLANSCRTFGDERRRLRETETKRERWGELVAIPRLSKTGIYSKIRSPQSRHSVAVVGRRSGEQKSKRRHRGDKQEESTGETAGTAEGSDGDDGMTAATTQSL